MIKAVGREPDGNLNSRVTFPWRLCKCRRVALARPHEHCQLCQRGVERPPPRLPDKPPRINRLFLFFLFVIRRKRRNCRGFRFIINPAALTRRFRLLRCHRNSNQSHRHYP